MDEIAKRTLTMKDAAAYCGMSERTFRDWFSTGVILSIASRPGSPRRKIRVERLEEFLVYLESEDAAKAERYGK